MVVFHKTRMCSFYKRGHCTRGTKCVFAHCQSELLPPPDFSCTRMCERFRATGHCNIAGCTFAHGRKDLRHRRNTDAEIALQKARVSEECPSTGTTRVGRMRCQSRQTKVARDHDAYDASPTWSSSTQSTADPCSFTSSDTTSSRQTGESMWCPTESEVSLEVLYDKAKAGGDSSSRMRRIHGQQVTVKHTFLHFGPPAAEPLRRQHRHT